MIYAARFAALTAILGAYGVGISYAALDNSQNRGSDVQTFLHNTLALNGSKGSDTVSLQALKAGKTAVFKDGPFYSARVGEASARVFASDGKPSSFYSLEPETKAAQISPAECERTARSFLTLAGLSADKLEFIPIGDKDRIRFTVRAHYQRFVSTQLISFEVSAATGAVRTATFGPWMNHAKLATSKLKSKTECLRAAKDAYSKYQPVRGYGVVKSEFMLGAPNWGKDVWNKLTPEHRKLIENRIAFPIFRVVLAKPNAERMHDSQIVDIDARTGKVLSILTMYSFGKAIGKP